MDTLTTLQQLTDEEFHQLCDAILRRLDPRYARLTPYGINRAGRSIKGQPDSYVGESVSTSTIAFQYSTEKKWWKKIVQDVLDVRDMSPLLEEIVVATSRDIDREHPPKSNINWLQDARAAAGNVRVKIEHGRRLSEHLDQDHQDLRHQYLGIPYSRLDIRGIIHSCNQSTEMTIHTLEHIGRFEPQRYLRRQADRDLFDLWTNPLFHSESSKEKVRLIALVNDSGVGKSSLLGTFSRSISPYYPVLFIRALDIEFTGEDSLLRHVIQSIEGFLSPDLRSQEEASLLRQFAQKPLTVILDGLDEATDPQGVRKAITGWLRSRLGKMSLLIVSSRPEFWRVCVDPSWEFLMPAVQDGDKGEKIARIRGNDIPGRFSIAELEAAWIVAGHELTELFVLPKETVEELKHPFTLRVFLDISTDSGIVPKFITRSQLLEIWLQHRLKYEEVASEHLTVAVYESALKKIAVKLSECSSSSLAVDDLTDVARFDSSHPPGILVQRLIASNVLESVPGQAERIRFTFDSVYEFYLANADIARICSDPKSVAESFRGLTFSESYLRLSRIASFLPNQEIREKFIEFLLQDDALKAAILLRKNCLSYTASIREKVLAALQEKISSQYAVHGALVFSLLSDIHCDESAELILKYLHSDNTSELHIILAQFALLKLNCPADLEQIYKLPWLGLNYYYQDLLALFRTVEADFRRALAEFALKKTATPASSEEHVRSVSILAYLGDDRLIEHLEQRLAENGQLADYENHALMALGTKYAGKLFVESAKKVATQLAKTSYEDGGIKRSELHHSISFKTADLRYLLTADFEKCINELLSSSDNDLFFLGYDLSFTTANESLVHSALANSARMQRPAEHSDAERISIDDYTWMKWWEDMKDSAIREHLLAVPPRVVTPIIEEILLGCLSSDTYRAKAAKHLGEARSKRCLPQLHDFILQTKKGDRSRYDLFHVLRAIGKIADDSSIGPLMRFIQENPGNTLQAVLALGFIGTAAAEKALHSSIGVGVPDEQVVGALIFCGTETAVQKAIEIAQSKPESASWLSENSTLFTYERGRRRGQYYTHIDTSKLTKFLKDNEALIFDKWRLLRPLEVFDSPDVRELLRFFAQRYHTSDDPILRSSDNRRLSEMCYRELIMRGDDSAIGYYLDESNLHILVLQEDLEFVERSAVAKELRGRLRREEPNTKRLVKLLYLLGRFGVPRDSDVVSMFSNHEDIIVSNIAMETLLRLTDPLAVPENWSSIEY